MSAADISERKKALRTELKARAQALSETYRAAADRQIREALCASEAWRRAESLFIYVSVRTEPDTRALIERALREGKRVYVPRCAPGGQMEALRLRRPEELKPGLLGIPEPPADAEALRPGEPDLAIVPCVTAARTGLRLGHGAGYYDRFLRKRPCPAFCLCYESLLSDELPTEEHDVRMDRVVTEKGIFETGIPQTKSLS